MMNQWLSLCIVLLLTACGSTPKTHFYVLEAINQPTIAVNNTKKILIGIGPLSLPAQLERRQIVTRQADNSVDMAEFHQWAAPLKDNMLAVLSKNIATHAPNALIKTYPWAAYGEMDYRVIMDVSRFDSELGKSAILEASWSIMSEKNHTIMSNGQTKLEQPLNGKDYATVVRTLNKLLADFSQQLAEQLPKN